MTPELHGKVGLVTGGASGIGRDVFFSEGGAKVVVAGRREVEGKETIMRDECVTNALCPGHEKRTMRESEIQIGNPE